MVQWDVKVFVYRRSKVVQWLALLSNVKKVLGLNPGSGPKWQVITCSLIYSAVKKKKKIDLFPISLFFAYLSHVFQFIKQMLILDKYNPSKYKKPF